jgi:type VI secretion system protein ImpG
LAFNQLKLENLCFFLAGAGDVQMRIYEQLFAHATSIVLQPTSRPVKWNHTLPPASIKPVGFQDNQALLPNEARCFSGYRLLHEYFALPARFMFFELAGRAPALKRCAEKTIDIVVLLGRSDPALGNRITAQNFALSCTPAINLFPKRADRIHLTDRFNEFQVIPDRTRPRDFEVYRVTRVIGHGARTDQEQEFTPFYAARDTGEVGPAYFTVNRVPRSLSDREQRAGRRSSYAGSDVYLSLVDALESPYRSDLRQLSVETMCTNRDLPLFVPVGRGETDFTLDTGDASAAFQPPRALPTPKANMPGGPSAISPSIICPSLMKIPSKPPPPCAICSSSTPTSPIR